MLLSKEKYANLLVEIKEEFPGFAIMKKRQSKLMVFFDSFLRVASFGQLGNFMSHFITTIDEMVYVPDEWDEWSPSRKAIVLRHERVHMRQARDFGKLKFFLLYLFFPLPAFLAYFRTKFEKEAYEESIKAYFEYYGAKFFTAALRNDTIKNFTTSNYLWMWPWKSDIEKWYDSTVASAVKISK